MIQYSPPSLFSSRLHFLYYYSVNLPVDFFVGNSFVNYFVLFLEPKDNLIHPTPLILKISRKSANLVFNPPDRANFISLSQSERFAYDVTITRESTRVP